MINKEIFNCGLCGQHTYYDFCPNCEYKYRSMGFKNAAEYYSIREEKKRVYLDDAQRDKLTNEKGHDH